MTTPEGTITFWLKHQHPDWPSNSNGYYFGPFSHEDLSVKAVKHPDKTLELFVSGPSGRSFEFKHPVPECPPKGLMVVITWTPKEMKLYLNTKLTETRQIE
jgi:hypothetical protein